MGESLDKKVVEDLNKNIPLGRMGMPEEFAQSVVGLVECGYINGTHLRLDGGLRLGYL